MSPRFPNAALAPPPENDCSQCSDSGRPGYTAHTRLLKYDQEPTTCVLTEFRPCPVCNPEGRDVVADEVRRLRARRGGSR